MRNRQCRPISPCPEFPWLEPEWAQPELSYVSFSLAERLEVVRAAHFAGLRYRVRWYFANLKCLAFIRHDAEEGEATVFLHSLLNHPQTPLPVIDGILTHELLHLVIPKEWEDGRMRSHPTRFRKREKQLIPELQVIWMWIQLNFSRALIKDDEKEGLFVKPRIARQIMRLGVLSRWEDTRYLCGMPEEEIETLAQGDLI